MPEPELLGYKPTATEGMLDRETFQMSELFCCMIYISNEVIGVHCLQQLNNCSESTCTFKSLYLFLIVV